MSHRSSLSSAADSLVRAIRAGLGIAGILVVFVSVGWAQRLADLTGTVADSSGALIPGVQVDATNTATGVAVTRAAVDCRGTSVATSARRME